MGVYAFTQDNLIIPLCSQGTTVSANLELDSFTMRGYEHATVCLLFGSTLSGDNVLTVETGSVDGADSADATFHYRYNSASVGVASSADVLTADATASTLTLTGTTYQDRMVVLEFEASELPVASGPEGVVYDWVQVDLDGAAASGFMTAWAILSKPRYAKAIMPGALV